MCADLVLAGALAQVQDLAVPGVVWLRGPHERLQAGGAQRARAVLPLSPPLSRPQHPLARLLIRLPFPPAFRKCPFRRLVHVLRERSKFLFVLAFVTFPIIFGTILPVGYEGR